MGLFKKPIVICGVCGRTVGEKEKRWVIKDGFLCPDCQKPFGIFDGSRAFIDYDAEQLKEMTLQRIRVNEFLEKNRQLYNSFQTTAIIENSLFVDDHHEKWYFDIGKNGVIDINGNVPVPLVFDFSDILEVYTSKGGKTIVSTSSTRKVKGIRKAVVGGIIAGGTGALLGGMMARSKTSTTTTESQDIYVNVVIDGETEPLSIPYSNEHSAEKVRHVLASRIKDPIDDKVPDKNSINSAADEILKYKNLLDIGAITQEEFDAKKRQLLGL